MEITMYEVTVFSRDGDNFSKEFEELDDAYEELHKAEEYYKAGGFEPEDTYCIKDIKPPLITEYTLVKHVYGNLWCRVSLSIEDMDYKRHEKRSKNIETPW